MTLQQLYATWENGGGGMSISSQWWRKIALRHESVFLADMKSVLLLPAFHPTLGARVLVAGWHMLAARPASVLGWSYP